MAEGGGWGWGGGGGEGDGLRLTYILQDCQLRCGCEGRGDGREGMGNNRGMVGGGGGGGLPEKFKVPTQSSSHLTVGRRDLVLP